MDERKEKKINILSNNQYITYQNNNIKHTEVIMKNI